MSYQITNYDSDFDTEYRNYVRKSTRVPTPPENPFHDLYQANQNKKQNGSYTEYFNNNQYSVHQRSKDYLMNIYNSRTDKNQNPFNDGVSNSITASNTASPIVTDSVPVLINAGLKLNSNKETNILNPSPKSSSISPLLNTNNNEDEDEDDLSRGEFNILEPKSIEDYYMNSQQSEVINPFTDGNIFSSFNNSGCLLGTCDIVNELAVSNESGKFQNDESNITKQDSIGREDTHEALTPTHADISNDDRNLQTSDTLNTLNTLKYHNDLRIKFEKIIPNLSTDEINLILNSDVTQNTNTNNNNINNNNVNFWENLKCLQKPEAELTILKTNLGNEKFDKVINNGNTKLFEFPSPNLSKNDNLSTLSTESVKVSKFNSNLKNYKNIRKEINSNPNCGNLTTTENDEFYSNTSSVTGSNTNTKSIISSHQTFSSGISSDDLDYYSKRYLTHSISSIESPNTNKRRLRFRIFHRRDKKNIDKLPSNESPDASLNKIPVNEDLNIDEQEISTIKNKSLYSKFFQTKSTKEEDNNEINKCISKDIETKSLNSLPINKKSHHHHSLRNFFKK